MLCYFCRYFESRIFVISGLSVGYFRNSLQFDLENFRNFLQLESAFSFISLFSPFSVNYSFVSPLPPSSRTALALEKILAKPPITSAFEHGQMDRLCSSRQSHRFLNLDDRLFWDGRFARMVRRRLFLEPGTCGEDFHPFTARCRRRQETSEIGSSVAVHANTPTPSVCFIRQISNSFPRWMVAATPR